MALVDKAFAALNPFFQHWSRSRIMGTLVALVVIWGVVAMFWLNMVGTESTSFETKYQEVFGTLIQQKLFVETGDYRKSGSGYPILLSLLRLSPLTREQVLSGSDRKAA